MFCNSKELQLLGTLNGGQSFRWKKIVKDDCELWYGVFASKVWILQQSHDHILYQVHERIPSDPKVNESLLKDYFQLDLNLEEHYGQWSKADANFQKASEQFYGIRILKQNPVENIFSFICSSCNNISRITSMVEKLAEFYGEIICEIEDKKWYSFATIEHLAGDNVEGKLRELGFGYRAKYISNSAKTILNNGGIKWVENLKSLEYEDAKRQLMTLQGIGAKVKLQNERIFIFYSPIVIYKFSQGSRLHLFNVFGTFTSNSSGYPCLPNSCKRLHATIEAAEGPN